MENDNGSQVAYDPRGLQNASFVPMLYQFRVTPGIDKTFALQQPFATLFDNLIAVLWSVYGKKSTIQIGINQLQWALEFLRCMKVDYNYPASVERIVDELEEQLIQLYAKVGGKIQHDMRKKEMEQYETENDTNPKTSKVPAFAAICASYNEADILKKLARLRVPLDSNTGEARYLRELNLLGRRKIKNQDTCAKVQSQNKKSSKTHVINALQKILKKTSEATTKTEVEELIKELKVENSATKKST